MRFVLFLFCLGTGLGTAFAAGIGFRADGTGHRPDADPPRTFSPTEGVVWATALPSWSNACPVVLEDRVFTCAEPDSLVAVDKATGEILWTRTHSLDEVLGPEKAAAVGLAKTHRDNGYTSATPVSDGERVFALFGNGVVAGYTIDGERLWRRFLEKPAHPWGHGASPVLAGGRLLVHVETLVALDPADGTEVWRQPAETWTDPRKKLWGTCAPTRIGDVDVVVTVAGRVIRAADGEVLFEDLGKATFSTPLVADGVVYFMEAGKGRAVRLPATVDGQPERLWEATTVNDRYYSSPALDDGILYAIARRGHFSAFDAETGEEIYRKKLLLAATEKEPNAAYASVTFAGGALFFTGVDGSVVVVKPGREYEELARNRVEKALRSTPVFEGGRIYLRAPEHLYCFGE